MALKRKGVWDISIEINGKEVKNNFKSVQKEVNNLNRELKGLTPGTEEFIKKAAELKKAKKHLEEIKDEMNGTSGVLSKITKQLGPLGPLILAAFSLDAAKSFFSTIASEINELRKLKGTLSQITDLQGKDLDRIASKVKAMATTFDSETDKMTEAAHNLSQNMNVDFDEALQLISEGFLDGADANGEFLDKIREYPALLDEAGFSAEQAIALMSQEVKLGIYSDKGVDAIKEANLRLREMPKATVEALGAIGLSSATIQKELTSGSKTTFDIMQEVSAKMATLPPQSKLVGTAIADIFGGPGEDAGYEYLANLQNIDLELGSVTESSDKYTQAKKLELKANEALNSIWVKLTGTGSSLSLLYSSLKLGLVDMLSALAGAKDGAKEASEAFDSQAKKVVSLEKNLIPLISEYENLSSKTNLSEAEQKRLKVIIEKISGAVPTAITQFDKYGKAMGISTDKAREFVETQKALLKYRNSEVIEEETEKLNGLNKELQGINETLSKRNEAGDIVKTVHTFTKTDRLIISEEKLGGNEIKKLQERAAEIKNIQLGVQASLDEHTGNYMEKFTKAENEKTEKTASEIEARKTLEATAQKFAIKNISNLSEAQLKDAINKSIEKKNQLAAIRAEDAKDRAKELKKERKALLKDQKEYREETLFALKSPLEQQEISYRNQLKLAGLAGKKKADMTEDDLLLLRMIQKSHDATIAQMELKATDDYIKTKEDAFNTAKTKRQISFNEEMASLSTLNEAKKKLENKISAQELSTLESLKDARKVLNREHERDELGHLATFFQESINMYTSAINSGEIEGVKFSDKILTEEQKEALNNKLDEVKLKISEVNAEKAGLKGEDVEEEEEVEKVDESGADFLGSTQEQWEKSFSNLDTAKGKLAAIGAVLGGLQEAWGMYSEFLAKNEQKQLDDLEKSNNKKKDKLDEQLENEEISEEEHAEKTEALNFEMEKKQAEIDYKQAKRKRTASLFSIAANTAEGISKAVALSTATFGMPWTAFVGAMGIAQAAAVMAAPLPDKGFYDGGFTGNKAIRYDSQDGVAIETPNGPYHLDEWVAPKWMTTSPRYAPTINWLEDNRKNKNTTGFYDGGYTNTPTASLDQPIVSDSNNENTMQLLLLQVTRLNDHLDTPIMAEAIIGDVALEKMRDRNLKIINSRENAKIQ